jgi:hypothetical protein
MPIPDTKPPLAKHPELNMGEWTAAILSPLGLRSFAQGWQDAVDKRGAQESARRGEERMPEAFARERWRETTD